MVNTKKLLNAICNKCESEEMYIEKELINSKIFKEKVKVFCKECGHIHIIDIR